MMEPESNPIGYLQEFVQKYHATSFPNYIESGVSGVAHSRLFTYKCEFNGHEVLATASTKKQAKTNSAREMIKLLVKNGFFDKYNVKVNPRVSTTNSGEQSKMPTNLPPAIDESKHQPSRSQIQFLKNPISLLQEYCQQHGMMFPNYTDSTSLSGEFVVECEKGDDKTYGSGTTKKAAKTEAAKNMCILLNLTGQSSEQEPKNGFIQNVKVKQELRAESPLSEQIPQLNQMIPAKSNDNLTRSSMHASMLLEEFRLDSESEDDDADPEENTECLETNLKSLSLHDSGVEINSGSDDGDKKLQPNGLEDNKNTHLHKSSTSETLLKWAKHVE